MRLSNIFSGRSNSIQTSRCAFDGSALLTSIGFKGFGGAEIMQRAEWLSIRRWPSIRQLIEARSVMVFVYLGAVKSRRPAKRLRAGRSEYPDGP